MTQKQPTIPDLERQAAELKRNASPLLAQVEKHSKEYMAVTVELITRKLAHAFPDADLMKAVFVGNLSARQQPEDIGETIGHVAKVVENVGAKVTHIVADEMRGEFHLFGLPGTQQ